MDNLIFWFWVALLYSGWEVSRFLSWLSAQFGGWQNAWSFVCYALGAAAFVGWAIHEIRGLHAEHEAWKRQRRKEEMKRLPGTAEEEDPTIISVERFLAKQRQAAILEDNEPEGA